MDLPLTTVLVVVAGATLVVALLLVVLKLAHHELQRWRGVRTAHYVAAVGEMVSRSMIPSNPPRAWALDPSFHDALADYRLLLTGDDRRFIDSLVDKMEIREVLSRRIQRRFPLSSRLRALSTLVNLADRRHVDLLRTLLGDRNSHVRLQAVRGLSRLGDVDSVKPMLDLAARTKAWEAARLADSLAAMGYPAADAIREWIEHETNDPHGSLDAVTLAARVLGLIGDPESEATLITLLRSNQPDWRVAAASALESTGGEAAIQPLMAALKDRSWRVKARAVMALGGLAHPDAALAMAPLLCDKVWWVRQNTAAAMGDLPGGTGHLIAALDGPDPYAADAALNQLTISGRLAAAIARVSNGDGTEQDRRLVDRAESPAAPVGAATI